MPGSGGAAHLQDGGVDHGLAPALCDHALENARAAVAVAVALRHETEQHALLAAFSAVARDLHASVFAAQAWHHHERQHSHLRRGWHAVRRPAASYRQCAAGMCIDLHVRDVQYHHACFCRAHGLAGRAGAAPSVRGNP